MAKLKRQIHRKEKELQAEAEAFQRIISERAEELQQMKDDYKRFKKEWK